MVRISKRRRKAVAALLASIVISILALFQQQGTFKPALDTAVQNQPGLYRVVNIADGDTISIDMEGVVERVRLIGVDTPETNDPRKDVQCYGHAASSFTKNLIGVNRVRLQTDSLSTNRDRYSRLLRYVYLPDGRLVNAEIIKQGYGFAYIHFPFTKLDEFKALQNTAEQQNLGLWNACDITIQESGQAQVK